MTIAGLEEFVQRARANGHTPDAVVNVNSGWSAQIKSIWVKASENDTVPAPAKAVTPSQPRVQAKKQAKRRAAAERTLTVSRRNGREPGSQPSLPEIVATHTIEPLRDELDEQVEIPNEHYHVKAIRAVFADRAMPITDRGVTLSEVTCVLVPEPWNEFDSNAVAVMIDGHQIGHLPAGLAGFYQPPLLLLARQQVLVSGLARIWAKREGRAVRARATLLIPEATALHVRH